MKHVLKQVPFLLWAAVLLGAAVAAAQGVDAAGRPAAAEPQAATAAGNAGHAADEKAIRATADDFVKAFNAADVKAVGALWAADAEYTDESGQSYHGRAAIEELYAGLFKEHPGATMTVNDRIDPLLRPRHGHREGHRHGSSRPPARLRGALHGGARTPRRQVDHGRLPRCPLRAGIQRGLPEGHRVADRRLDGRPKEEGRHDQV